MLSAWTGITQPRSWGEKQALSLCYTVIYYCTKVIIINLELHLLRGSRDRKKREIISHVKLSPLDLFIRVGLSRHLWTSLAVHTCVCKIRIHTLLISTAQPFFSVLFTAFSPFSPGNNQTPPLFSSGGDLPLFTSHRNGAFGA